MFLAVGVLELQFVQNAHAGMMATSEVVTQLNMAQERRKVADYLQREDVKSQLVKFGVHPDEASLRLASLSDAEIQKLSGQIDKSVAGGDAIVTISLFTILIVVLIIYLIRRI